MITGTLVLFIRAIMSVNTHFKTVPSKENNYKIKSEQRSTLLNSQEIERKYGGWDGN